MFRWNFNKETILKLWCLAASSSPENLLEVQILGPYLKPSESETLKGVGIEQSVF